MKRFALRLSVVMLLLIAFSSCYGTFTATKKIYRWNGTFGNKFVKSIVMWGLYIVPVYELAGTADLLFLNVVEFWTGSNPIAMPEGMKEEQLVASEGQSYKMTATSGRMDIENCSTGETVSLFYNKKDQTLSVKSGDASYEIATKANAE